MSLEFHMEHDSTPGLQADRIQPGQESKMGADTKKIAKPLKSTFSAEWQGVFG